jgi:hypothetical protein
LRRRGFILQGSFLVLGTCATAVTAAKADHTYGRVMWSLSSALLLAVVPYTIVVLMPTTQRILRQVQEGLPRTVF